MIYNFCHCSVLLNSSLLCQLKVELSNWLQEYLSTGASTGAEGVVLWPELRVVLESMEERLVQRLATPQV